MIYSYWNHFVTSWWGPPEQLTVYCDGPGELYGGLPHIAFEVVGCDMHGTVFVQVDWEPPVENHEFSIHFVPGRQEPLPVYLSYDLERGVHRQVDVRAEDWSDQHDSDPEKSPDERV